MSDQDTKGRRPEPVEQDPSQCDPVTPNPPVHRWVVWNAQTGDWDVNDSNNPNSRKKKPIILADGSGGHDIQFHLNTPAGSQWQFDTSDPIWTADNVDCGTLSGRASDQIVKIRPTARLLTVFDKNDGSARLVRYQLNFVDAGGGTPPPACDPAILNGGGGKT